MRIERLIIMNIRRGAITITYDDLSNDSKKCLIHYKINRLGKYGVSVPLEIKNKFISPLKLFGMIEKKNKAILRCLSSGIL